MMPPVVARAIARIGVLLHLLDSRPPMAERLFQERHSEQDVQAIRQACHAAGVKLGAYYGWKLRQMAVSSTLEQLDRAPALALMQHNDSSAYAALDEALDVPDGLILAIPHHGHFVMAICALCERIRSTRDVFVFYDSPGTNAKNAVFDAMREKLFGSPQSRVNVLHNDRAGLARAIRELRKGNIVVLMPDVYKAAGDTYQVPFCGRPRNAMLGTATIARRSGARVLPVVANERSGLFGFENAFGALLSSGHSDGSPAGNLHADYRLTLAMYRAFEPMMRDRLHHWQYVANHMAASALTTTLDSAELIGMAAPLFLRDPNVQVQTAAPILL